ncbi:MAG: 1-acyl-sn-glycerol-3-phosphate acyltransferase [Prevotellaceae bacterium]|jgi:putative hemolysin|nr:1-acyl-sn-glycerol-3-phosphate acyltransferase [Prevotellaceae bacterium]
MYTEEELRFDVAKILKEKAPNKKVPKFIVNYLRRIIHEEELNRFMELHGRKRNMEFIEAIHDFYDITTTVEGTEKLPRGGKYIFVSNHPLGGMDGVSLAYYIGKEYENKVKIYANDILLFVRPLNDIFIPINKTGSQAKGNALITQEFFESDCHLITFPAGACSRKINGKIVDTDWRKNFIGKSVQHKRDIVPLYFEGRNTNFFYNLAKLRKFLGIKLNIEMLYLADEFAKQRGKRHRIYIGEAIPWQTFDKSKSQAEWAQWVKEKVYAIRK